MISSTAALQGTLRNTSQAFDSWALCSRNTHAGPIKCVVARCTDRTQLPTRQILCSPSRAAHGILYTCTSARQTSKSHPAFLVLNTVWRKLREPTPGAECLGIWYAQSRKQGSKQASKPRRASSVQRARAHNVCGAQGPLSPPCTSFAVRIW